MFLHDASTSTLACGVKGRCCTIIGVALTIALVTHIVITTIYVDWDLFAGGGRKGKSGNSPPTVGPPWLEKNLKESADDYPVYDVRADVEPVPMYGDNIEDPAPLEAHGSTTLPTDAPWNDYSAKDLHVELSDWEKARAAEADSQNVDPQGNVFPAVGDPRHETTTVPTDAPWNDYSSEDFVYVELSDWEKARAVERGEKIATHVDELRGDTMFHDGTLHHREDQSKHHQAGRSPHHHGHHHGPHHHHHLDDTQNHINTPGSRPAPTPPPIRRPVFAAKAEDQHHIDTTTPATTTPDIEVPTYIYNQEMTSDGVRRHSERSVASRSEAFLDRGVLMKRFGDKSSHPRGHRYETSLHDYRFKAGDAEEQRPLPPTPRAHRLPPAARRQRIEEHDGPFTGRRSGRFQMGLRHRNNDVLPEAGPHQEVEATTSEPYMDMPTTEEPYFHDDMMMMMMQDQPARPPYQPERPVRKQLRPIIHDSEPLRPPYDAILSRFDPSRDTAVETSRLESYKEQDYKDHHIYVPKPGTPARDDVESTSDDVDFTSTRASLPAGSLHDHSSESHEVLSSSETNRYRLRLMRKHQREQEGTMNEESNDDTIEEESGLRRNRSKAQKNRKRLGKTGRKHTKKSRKRFQKVSADDDGAGSPDPNAVGPLSGYEAVMEGERRPKKDRKHAQKTSSEGIPHYYNKIPSPATTPQSAGQDTVDLINEQIRSAKLELRKLSKKKDIKALKAHLDRLQVLRKELTTR